MNRPNHLLMNVLYHIAAVFQVPSHHSLHNMMYIQVQQKCVVTPTAGQSTPHEHGSSEARFTSYTLFLITEHTQCPS
jgi:hypothetical protein